MTFRLTFMLLVCVTPSMWAEALLPNPPAAIGVPTGLLGTPFVTTPAAMGMTDRCAQVPTRPAYARYKGTGAVAMWSRSGNSGNFFIFGADDNGTANREEDDGTLIPYKKSTLFEINEGWLCENGVWKSNRATGYITEIWNEKATYIREEKKQEMDGGLKSLWIREIWKDHPYLMQVEMAMDETRPKDKSKVINQGTIAGSITTYLTDKCGESMEGKKRATFNLFSTAWEKITGTSEDNYGRERSNDQKTWIYSNRDSSTITSINNLRTKIRSTANYNVRKCTESSSVLVKDISNEFWHTTTSDYYDSRRSQLSDINSNFFFSTSKGDNTSTTNGVHTVTYDWNAEQNRSELEHDLFEYHQSWTTGTLGTLITFVRGSEFDDGQLVNFVAHVDDSTENFKMDISRGPNGVWTIPAALERQAVTAQVVEQSLKMGQPDLGDGTLLSFLGPFSLGNYPPLGARQVVPAAAAGF